MNIKSVQIAIEENRKNSNFKFLMSKKILIS